MMKNKIFFFICLIVFLVINLKLKAQAVTEIEVKQVIESANVDSLLDENLKYAKSKNGYFEMTVFNSVKGFEFWLIGKESSKSIFNIGFNYTKIGSPIPKYQDNIRYFIYKGFTVFIDHDPAPEGMFIETSKSRKFRFIKGTSHGAAARFFCFTSYNYVKNQFVEIIIGYD